MWTTLGLERQLNPRLQVADREDFVAHVVRELERPPYFRRMEVWNVEGAPLLGDLPTPPPLSAQEFARQAPDAIVLDTRMEVGFGAAHVPGALSIWMSGLPSFCGWFVPYDRPILLVNETDDPTQAVRYLTRMGYDVIAGYLSGGMLSWHLAGQESTAIPTTTVQALCHQLDAHEDLWILDVRSDDEVAANEIPGAHHIHVTQLPGQMGQVPQDRTVYVFCGSGLRSMTAASLLQRAGWQNLVVVLGGLAGWHSTTCPLDL